MITFSCDWLGSNFLTAYAKKSLLDFLMELLKKESRDQKQFLLVIGLLFGDAEKNLVRYLF